MKDGGGFEEVRGGNAREGEGCRGWPRLDSTVREENHRRWKFLAVHILILCLATNSLLMSINIFHVATGGCEPPEQIRLERRSSVEKDGFLEEF